VRRLLVEGCVEPDWREPQYSNVQLTSSRKCHAFGPLLDAAEMAYGANVCDGDYGENIELGSRPASYVVPNLASMLLVPIEGGAVLRTEFGQQVAKGLASTLGLRAFSENEVRQAFDSIDQDGNGHIDFEEVQMLLQSVYDVLYQRKPTEEEQAKFFKGFNALGSGDVGFTYAQLKIELIALRQELEGGSEGSELAEVRTEADAQRMIARFTPTLRNALDKVFCQFSSDGESLSQDELSQFLLKVNGQLDRGGTSRHAAEIFKRKIAKASEPVLNREDWYGVFAKELGEGKWWQVVYDLEECGVNMRSQDGMQTGQHYQGWLDYVYFGASALSCTGVQEALTPAEQSRLYFDGDALPNEWHPSDHLPVAVLLSWARSKKEAVQFCCG